MRFKFFATLVLVFAMLSGNAQEQLGLKISNYSGVNSFQLNPAWTIGGPLKWDVNIVSLGVFMEQDYAYGKRGSMLQLLRNGGDLITDEAAVSADGSSTSNGVPFYFAERRNFDAHHNAFVMAPSFMATVQGHTFGMYLQGRSWLSGYNIDGDLGYSNVSDTMVFVGNIDPFQIGAMSWGEIGVNYGRTIRANKNLQINAGGTLKFLLGYDAVSVSNNISTGVNRANDAVTVDPANVGISYATNYSEGNGYDFQRNGFGVATDLGVTFINPNAKQDKQQYRWKVGISLLDVGRLWYKKNASEYAFVSEEISTFQDDPFADIADVDGVIEAINASGNVSSAELVDNSFGMWSPMALSVQFDAPLIDRLYLSGTAVIGMRFKGAAIERSDLIAVTPRFEMKWFEMGVPVSLYRWNDFRVGTYLRMGPLTVGTENLNSWVIPGRLEGSDIYLSLKINSAMFKKSSNINGKGEGCYSREF